MNQAPKKHMRPQRKIISEEFVSKYVIGLTSVVGRQYETMSVEHMSTNGNLFGEFKISKQSSDELSSIT